MRICLVCYHASSTGCKYTRFNMTDYCRPAFSLALFLYFCETHVFFSQGSRGFSSDIVIIDEFSFVPPEVLYENALIQMVVEHRSLFIMSSPIEAESERMQLLNKRTSSTGLPYFDVLNLGLMCDKCSKAKISVCPHLVDNRSAWKSLKSQKMLEVLLPTAYYKTEVAASFQLLLQPHHNSSLPVCIWVS